MSRALVKQNVKTLENFRGADPAGLGVKNCQNFVYEITYFFDISAQYSLYVNRKTH